MLGHQQATTSRYSNTPGISNVHNVLNPVQSLQRACMHNLPCCGPHHAAAAAAGSPGSYNTCTYPQGKLTATLPSPPNNPAQQLRPSLSAHYCSFFAISCFAAASGSSCQSQSFFTSPRSAAWPNTASKIAGTMYNSAGCAALK